MNRFEIDAYRCDTLANFFELCSRQPIGGEAQRSAHYEPAKREVRRNRDSAEFLHEIRGLKSLGYSVPKIAEKAQCCDASVESMLYLLKNGHPSLIAEVENGHIPHTIALQISRTKNPELQIILANGFKAGTVNTSQIVTIRQRVDELRERNNTTRVERVTRIRSFEFSPMRQPHESFSFERAKLVKSQTCSSLLAHSASCSPTSALSACYVQKAFIRCQAG